GCVGARGCGRARSFAGCRTRFYDSSIDHVRHCVGSIWSRAFLLGVEAVRITQLVAAVLLTLAGHEVGRAFLTAASAAVAIAAIASFRETYRASFDRRISSAEHLKACGDLFMQRFEQVLACGPEAVMTNLGQQLG